MFYERSQGLIGICRDVATCSSRTLTLDLQKYDDVQADEETVSSRGQKRSRSSSTGPRKRDSSESVVSKQ